MAAMPSSIASSILMSMTCATIVHLLAGDGQRLVQPVFENHAGEGARTGDIGTLTDN